MMVKTREKLSRKNISKGQCTIVNRVDKENFIVKVSFV